MFRRISLISLGLIFLVLFVYSSIQIVMPLRAYHTARTEYIQLRNDFGIPPMDAISLPEPFDDEYLVECDDFEQYLDELSQKNVFFDILYNINSDVVFWLVLPGSNVSYPVVQGVDNELYLRRTFQGEQNASGAIFLDYRNCANLTDVHTLIYGHNMLDGSMFAALHSWDGDHFIIFKPDEIIVYRVLDRQTMSDNDALFFIPNDVWDNEDSIVTLSTCVSGAPHLRYVVHGQRLSPPS